MRQALLERSPDVWKTACQEMARRALGGTVAFPAVIALLALAGNLHQSHPAVFAAIVTCAGLLGLGRLIFIYRLEPLYARSPRVWLAVFFGTALVTAALYSGLLYFLAIENGAVPLVVYALAATMGIQAMVIVVYFHSLPFVLSFILVLGAPPAAAVMRLAGTDPTAFYLAWASSGATLYLLWVGWQQHRERWTGLGTGTGAIT